MSLSFWQRRVSRCGAIYRLCHEWAGASFVGKGVDDEFRPEHASIQIPKSPLSGPVIWTAAELWATDSK